MISAEDFEEIVEAVAANKDVTQEQVSSLIDVIRRLDLQLLIAQNGLELTLTNAHVVIPNLAERVLSLAGRTDQKIKKKVAELAAQNVIELESSVQAYLVKATIEAMNLLGINFEDEDEDEDENINITKEDPYAGEAPHNHD